MSGESARRVSRNAALLLAGTGFRMVLSLALVLLVARMGVQDFGSYSLGVHYFELCLSLTATAVGIYLTREAAKRPRRTGELLIYGLLLVGVLTAACAVLLTVAAHGLGYSDLTRNALAIGCLALLPAATAVVLEATFIARERAGFVTMGTALESSLRLGLSFAILALGGGVRELFFALVVSRTVLAAFYFNRLMTMGPLRWRFRRSGLGSFLRQWRVFAGENWLATLHTSLDVILLSAIYGEAVVGIYDAAYKFIRLGSVVARSYTTAVFPLLSRLASGSRDAFLRLSGDSVRFMLAVAVPIGVAVTLLADRIIAALYLPEFAPAGAVLRILVWVLALECVNPFLSHTLFAQGAQRRSLHVALVSLTVNLLTTPLLAVHYGAPGAAAGTLLAGLVAACCYAAFSLPRRHLMQLGWTVLKIAGAGLVLAAGMRAVLPDAWPLALAVGAAVYLAAVAGLRIVTLNDVRAFRGAGGVA